MSATEPDAFDLYLQQQRDDWNRPENVAARRQKMYAKWGKSNIDESRFYMKQKAQLVDLSRPPAPDDFRQFFTIDIVIESDIGIWETFGIVWAHYPEKMLCLEGHSEPFIDFDAYPNNEQVYILRDWSPEYEHLRERLTQLTVELKLKQRMKMLNNIEKTQSELEAQLQKTQRRLRKILDLKERCIAGIAAVQEKINKFTQQ
ncbi:MAG: hypothetical protein ACOVQN_04435 [Exiguobacterium sp.]